MLPLRGFPLASYNSRDSFTACRPLLRPIAPDVRGFGQSAQPPRSFVYPSTTWAS